MIYPSVPAGRGYSTSYATMDFETYSEAGYVFNEDLQKWKPIVKSPPYGWLSVGSPAYAQHKSTEILCMAYDLKRGAGRKLWIPTLPPPSDLFEYIVSGGLVEAHNSAFEWYIWNWVAVLKLGWRVGLPHTQLRCSSAKARAHSLPSALKNVGKALDAPIKKEADGERLIKKFSNPRNPTKNDPRRRIRPEEDTVDACKLYAYCLDDVSAEDSISAMIPDLSPVELDYWLLDQQINYRGAHIDTDAMADCKAIVDQATVRYNDELRAITGGYVESVTKLDDLKDWLVTQGVGTKSLDAEHVVNLLGGDNIPDPSPARRALELRQILGSASVKKLGAIERRLTSDGRLHDLFKFCGADRTGRTSGAGVQPQNLPNSGADVKRCLCGNIRGLKAERCTACGASEGYKIEEWGIDAVNAVLEVIKERDVSVLEDRFGDALGTLSGCLRGLFSAREGYELICSDFSAIEAVVLAHIAGVAWRIEVFKTHGKIYEASASKTFNVPLEEILEYKERTGDHHPLRKKGKVQELASGFGGGLGAWRAFGAEGTDAEVDRMVKAWRLASPEIKDLWYSIEDRATWAVQNAGRSYTTNGITYGYKGDILYCQLPSGRALTYHHPRLEPTITPWGAPTTQLSYMGWNTDYKKGKIGWIRLETWGGKLVENLIQAISRDLMFYSMLNLERAGYPVVLQIHDEIVAEVLKGFGSVEEFERIMSAVPIWARGWAIRASGGWRGIRYRK